MCIGSLLPRWQRRNRRVATTALLTPLQALPPPATPLLQASCRTGRTRWCSPRSAAQWRTSATGERQLLLSFGALKRCKAAAGLLPTLCCRV